MTLKYPLFWIKNTSFSLTILTPKYRQIYGYLVTILPKIPSFFRQKTRQNRSKIKKHLFFQFLQNLQKSPKPTPVLPTLSKIGQNRPKMSIHLTQNHPKCPKKPQKCTKKTLFFATFSKSAKISKNP